MDIPATDVAAVKTWLRIDATDATDDDVITAATGAANAFVARQRCYRELAEGDPVPDDLHTGATMLAARIFRRRNSPGGVESFSDAAVYVSRSDPDVAALLSLGVYKAPQVG